mgnify:CR=1 FL=1|tara:strand:- start:555 stop:725 length:171 start_codon:yes stop_codon:yes gene_type:complete
MKYIQDFKDGTTDALLHGQMREKHITPEYKQGYDFGLYLWQEQKEFDRIRHDDYEI